MPADATSELIEQWRTTRSPRVADALDATPVAAGKYTRHVFAGGTRVASVMGTAFVGGSSPPPPTTPGTAYYFHSNPLGSTSVLTDDTGAVQESLEYFVDGESWIDRAPAGPTSYLFSGKQFDRNTGFYDFGQRFYDPRTSLWLGLDPAFMTSPTGAIGRPLLLSLLAYGANSPGGT